MGELGPRHDLHGFATIAEFFSAVWTAQNGGPVDERLQPRPPQPPLTEDEIATLTEAFPDDFRLD